MEGYHNIDIPLALRLRFSTAGSLGVTEWWLEQHQSLPIQEVAYKLQHLLLRVMKETTA
ncbi:hypothetical protein KSC_087840 [Ktedonobacter sp. SOSP1-52]|uniref:hypothetical protein n=1 Tax=Ktedonobacter sp. SOSP1-52 TaxID=2778366 RepID=UPI0019153C4F|nr:hypothetical protein [Ktedonobacter sp. SOSP1-52]GHO69892.1 hypothetical protein KSC_087840 [Ktedonobacter sp. SOSP1-52]